MTNPGVTRTQCFLELINEVQTTLNYIYQALMEDDTNNCFVATAVGAHLCVLASFSVLSKTLRAYQDTAEEMRKLEETENRAKAIMEKIGKLKDPKGDA